MSKIAFRNKNEVRIKEKPSYSTGKPRAPSLDSQATNKLVSN